jgi:hypothetical protein
VKVLQRFIALHSRKPANGNRLLEIGSKAPLFLGATQAGVKLPIRKTVTNPATKSRLPAMFENYRT